MIAYLGTGLLGANFVRALLRNGHQVQVWNRTLSKAKELEQYGAVVFESAAEAVKNATTIHLTLKDDASVDEVLEAAFPGLEESAIIIDHTTTSKEGAIKRTQLWKERGFNYQHAPVFMGPVNALESTGVMLISGDQELIAKIDPELSKMTGKLLNLGAEIGKAACMKLIGNCFLVGFTASLVDALMLANSLDIPTEDVATLFESWNPGTMLSARMNKITTAAFHKPTWELSMARKDTGLFIDAVSKTGKNLMIMPAIAEAMDKLIDKGHGNDDWTVIAKDALE